MFIAPPHYFRHFRVQYQKVTPKWFHIWPGWWGSSSKKPQQSDMNGKCVIVGTTNETKNQLETLRNGLMLLSDTLNALAMPYPPPSVRPQQKFTINRVTNRAK
jgi:hypothetical protein